MPSGAYEVFQPGALFHERYRIDHCIKAGGMGAVYEIVDERTESRRALKVMLPSLVEDADLRARFELEARVTGKIESDHLARVSDAGVDEATGMPFLVMDLLRGEELGALLAKRGHLPPGEVVLYLFEAALALDKTHAAGIIHRDLKPENLFVTVRDDGTPCIKVFDFGIAKVVDRGSKRSTRAMGTPLYMSPEQIRGDGTLGPAADLYALGHIAYALLVGEAYWSEEVEAGQTLFATLSTVLLGAKEPPSARARRRREVALPAAFDAWFLKATAPRPEDRFERATDTIEALAVAVGVSLQRASLSVMPSAATKGPAISAPAARDAALARPSGGQTAPLIGLPPEALESSAHVAPTELMGAAISRPPPAARRRRRSLFAGIAVAVAAVAAAAAVVVPLALRGPSPREGAGVVPVLTAALPPALTSAPPPALAVEPARPEAPATPPASASAPAEAPDAGPERAPVFRPPPRPAPAAPRPTRTNEGIF